MNTKRFGAILLALMVLLSGVGALAGTVGASQNEAFDGTQADSADQTNTTYIATNSDLDNVTANMTEDQTGSTSYFFSTPNVTASSVDPTMSSGSVSGTNIVDDGFYVNVSATGDVVDYVNVTFNVSTSGNSSGNLTDYLDVSYENWMTSESVLVEDPDASENQTYLIYARDKVLDTDLSFEDGNVTFNESSGEIQTVNGSDGVGQAVVTFTRNNTTYEDVPMSVLRTKVGFNTTYFSDINFQDDESLEAGELELKDVKTEDGKKTWVLDVVNPNNQTLTYTATYNVTVLSGETNNNTTFAYSSVQDPDGGVQTESETAFTHAIGGSLTTGPQFTESLNLGNVPIWVWGVVGGGVLIVVYMLYKGRSQGPYTGQYSAELGGSVFLWIIAVGAGVWMLVDSITVYLGVMPDQAILHFWTGMLGTPLPAVVGLLLIVVTGAINLGRINDKPLLSQG